MWVKIEGFSQYAINKNGDVINWRRNLLRKTFKNPSGTICIGLRNNKGVRKNRAVHRLVAETFLEKTDDTLTNVKFKDGNKENLHVDNLYWAKAEAYSPITKKGVIPSHAGGKQIGLNHRMGSKYFGVSTPESRPNTWVSSTTHRGKVLFNRHFKCEIEAAKFYDFQIKKYGLFFRELNFPDE